MPLRLEIKKRILVRSGQVYSVDCHPEEPWLLIAVSNGTVHLWNHELQELVSSFEVTDLPVRAAKFVVQKSWIVAGSDDVHIRVFNYNTSEKVYTIQAHNNYITSIIVHPTLPYILSSSDDMLIKLWDWEKEFQCVRVFEGHDDSIMTIALNPSNSNQFASASLDGTVKVWQLDSPHDNFTLEGHNGVVNCVDFFPIDCKPHLVSGADDGQVKLWDYETKTCVETLQGHHKNVTTVAFHPNLPMILAGCEDGTVRVWHSGTYRLETILNYGIETVRYICCSRASNVVCLGSDKGSMIIKISFGEPTMTAGRGNRILWTECSELQEVNLLDVKENDSEKSSLVNVKVEEDSSLRIEKPSTSHTGPSICRDNMIQDQDEANVDGNTSHDHSTVPDNKEVAIKQSDGLHLPTAQCYNAQDQDGSDISNKCLDVQLIGPDNKAQDHTGVKGTGKESNDQHIGLYDNASFKDKANSSEKRPTDPENKAQVENEVKEASKGADDQPTIPDSMVEGQDGANVVSKGSDDQPTTSDTPEKDKAVKACKVSDHSVMTMGPDNKAQKKNDVKGGSKESIDQPTCSNNKTQDQARVNDSGDQLIASDSSDKNEVKKVCNASDKLQPIGSEKKSQKQNELKGVSKESVDRPTCPESKVEHQDGANVVSKGSDDKPAVPDAPEKDEAGKGCKGFDEQPTTAEPDDNAQRQNELIGTSKVSVNQPKCPESKVKHQDGANVASKGSDGLPTVPDTLERNEAEKAYNNSDEQPTDLENKSQKQNESKGASKESVDQPTTPNTRVEHEDTANVASKGSDDKPTVPDTPDKDEAEKACNGSDEQPSGLENKSHKQNESKKASEKSVDQPTIPDTKVEGQGGTHVASKASDDQLTVPDTQEEGKSKEGCKDLDKQTTAACTDNKAQEQNKLKMGTKGLEDQLTDLISEAQDRDAVKSANKESDEQTTGLDGKSQDEDQAANTACGEQLTESHNINAQDQDGTSKANRDSNDLNSELDDKTEDQDGGKVADKGADLQPIGLDNKPQDQDGVSKASKDCDDQHTAAADDKVQVKDAANVVGKGSDDHPTKESDEQLTGPSNNAQDQGKLKRPSEVSDDRTAGKDGKVLEDEGAKDAGKDTDDKHANKDNEMYVDKKDTSFPPATQDEQSPSFGPLKGLNQDMIAVTKKKIENRIQESEFKTARGIAFIVGIFGADGTDEDVKNVESTFRELNFAVYVEKDPLAEELACLVQAAAECEYPYRFNYVAFYFAGHGGKDDSGKMFVRGLQRDDSEPENLHIDDYIIDPLKGLVQTRLFFFDCCQTPGKGNAFRDDHVITKKPKPHPSQVIAYAANEGQKSFGDKTNGGIWTYNLCKNLKKEEPITTVLAMTFEDVVEERKDFQEPLTVASVGVLTLKKARPSIEKASDKLEEKDPKNLLRKIPTVEDALEVLEGIYSDVDCSDFKQKLKVKTEGDLKSAIEEWTEKEPVEVTWQFLLHSLKECGKVGQARKIFDQYLTSPEVYEKYINTRDYTLLDFGDFNF